MSDTPRIAIIGAGLCGLTLAHRVTGQAHVTLFEKSRGLGGRMSTRRADPYTFDHGAQYFTAKGQAFQRFLAPHIAGGVVTEWKPLLTVLGQDARKAAPETHPRYVAQPAMNSLCKTLAEGFDIRAGTEVAGLTREGAGWVLHTREGADFGGFDWVVSTAPAVQTNRLMPEGFAGKAALSKARMSGCYSLMLGFSQAEAPQWDAARVTGHPLAWIAVNSRKPGRDGALSLLCQSSNAWAEANLERDQQDIRDELLADFTSLTGMDAAADYVSLHRWRYANVETTSGAPCLLDPDLKLGAAGDWCGAGRVEAAFDSAVALARDILSDLRVTAG